VESAACAWSCCFVRDPAQLGPVARGTTAVQALFQHPNGVLQIPFGKIQEAEVSVDHDRCVPPAVQCSKAERLLSIAPTLGEGSKRAQGLRQLRPGLDPQGCAERARRLVRSLHVPPQQLSRPAEVADSPVDLPQVVGCSHLQGTFAKRDRELEGLLACRNSTVWVKACLKV
jgi:hypothetical protein